MKSLKWDLLICAFLVVVLAVFMIELRDITPVARIYPISVIIGSLVMICIVAAQAVYRSMHSISRETENAPPMDKMAVLCVLTYGLAILAYIILMNLIGYFISSILFIFFSLVYQNNKNKTVTIVLPVAFTVFIYVVFSRFLYVTLPMGSWIENIF